MHELIELLVADPHPATRGALRVALAPEEGIRVAGEVGDMAAAIRSAADARITLAIVGSSLAGLHSPLALAGLRGLAHRVPVVVMGMGDPALYAAAYAAEGASGYWAKDGDLAVLVSLLRAARRPASGRPAG